MYDGGVSVQEYDAEGSLKTALIRAGGYGGGIGDVVYTEKADGSGREYFLYNATGTTSALTDDSGAVTGTSCYTAWGTETAATGETGNVRKFSTKERSELLGIDYFGFRYYDPDLGRFLTRDPSGYPDGPNNYLYCMNSPVNNIDPLGLETEDELNLEAFRGGSGRSILQKSAPASQEIHDESAQQLNAVKNGLEAAERIHPINTVSALGYGEDVTGEKLSPAEIGVEAASVLTGPALKLAKVARKLLGSAVDGIKGAKKLTQAGKVANKLEDSVKAFRGAKTGEVVSLDSSAIRFTQDDISRNFSTGGKVEDLIKDLKSGKTSIDDIPPVRVFERDGKLYSLDNRRLYAAKEAGVELRVEKMDLKEAEKFMKKQNRFTTKNDGVSIEYKTKGKK